MATIPDTQTVITIADISEYLVSEKIAANNFYPSQVLDTRHPILLLMERTAVDWAYSMNQNDPTLIKTGGYLYSLCGPYAPLAEQIIDDSTQSPPEITGPVDQTVNVGGDATFSVTVVSSLPVIYQWYLNGNPILGAVSSSYTKTDAQLDDDGEVYSVKVSNEAGDAFSNPAILTVMADVVGYYYFGVTDYSNQLNAGIDSVPFIGTFPITVGNPLSVQFPPEAATERFIVVKYPVTETTKTNYSNAPINNGAIPSIAFDNVKTITTWKYIFSRNGNPFSQNTSNPVIFS